MNTICSKVFICFAIMTVLFYSTDALSDEELRAFHPYNDRVKYDVIRDSGKIKFRGSGLPHHPWQQQANGPIPSEQNYEYDVSLDPNRRSPTCLPRGPIGLLINGVVIYSPVSEVGCDAALVDTKDNCSGQIDQNGQYFYRGIPTCLHLEESSGQVMGVAFDGFPIYGVRAVDLGREVTSQDLDECHGRLVNGHYRYHMTREWPYIIGCFKGQVIMSLNQGSVQCSNSGGSDLCSCEHAKVFSGSPEETVDGEPCQPRKPTLAEEEEEGDPSPSGSSTTTAGQGDNGPGDATTPTPSGSEDHVTVPPQVGEDGNSTTSALPAGRGRPRWRNWGGNPRGRPKGRNGPRPQWRQGGTRFSGRSHHSHGSRGSHGGRSQWSQRSRPSPQSRGSHRGRNQRPSHGGAGARGGRGRQGGRRN